MTATAALEQYREDYFRAVADFHDQEIEWNLPSKIPAQHDWKKPSMNPEGINFGPPHGRHGMTKAG